MSQAGLVVYNADEMEPTKIVYYSGEDELKAGYCLCYKHDATVYATDRKLARGVQVVKPATNNLKLFAGVVHTESDGVTGPGYIKIVEPRRGTMVNALCKSNSTVNTTELKLANGEYHMVAGTEHRGAENVAVAGETKNTSTTEANAFVYLT